MKPSGQNNIPIPPARPTRRSLSLAILVIGLSGGFHAPATTAAETLLTPPESTPNPGTFLELNPAQFRHYVDTFNREIPGRTAHFIPDASSWEWIRDNIPFLEVPDEDLGFEVAWKQLLDTEGFYAPYGPTTAEQRHPGFRLVYTGDACQWNGPSWPFSTSITLRAMANLLNRYDQQTVSKEDYFKILQIYTGQSPTPIL